MSGGESERRSGQDRREGSFQLTARERQVLELVLAGEPNKEIAIRLGLAEQSIKQYVSDLLRKFDVPNRAALAEAGARLTLVGDVSIDRSWFPQLFRGAGLVIAITRGPEHRYVTVNHAFAKAVHREVIGKTMREAFPELEGTGNFDIADRVYATGETFVAHEVAAMWDRGAGNELTYTDGILQALRGDDGEIEGLVFFGINVTDQVRARKVPV